MYNIGWMDTSPYLMLKWLLLVGYTVAKCEIIIDNMLCNVLQPPIDSGEARLWGDSKYRNTPIHSRIKDVMILLHNLFGGVV